jgi:uncharacterized protein YaaQ
VNSLFRRLARVANTYDAFVPWLVLAVVGGATLVVVQVLVVRLLH